MKTFLLWLSLFLLAGSVSGQKTMLLERIGTHRRHWYHAGDPVKFRVGMPDTLLTGRLGVLDSGWVTVEGMRSYPVKTCDIHSVYVKFSSPRRAGKILMIAGAGIFSIIGINHLLNHEKLFSPDMFLISGGCVAAGAISLSFGQKRCKVGDRWKIKVLDINIR